MTLKELRDSKGLQRKFVVARIGISGKHLNDIEGGRVNLTERCAAKLSQFYGVDINTIKKMYEESKNENSRDFEKAEKIAQ